MSVEEIEAVTFRMLLDSLPPGPVVTLKSATTGPLSFFLLCLALSS